MAEKLKIFVCTHKKSEYTRNGGVYLAVQGGAELHKELELGFVKDNIGDNISIKNPYYSELTVLYWGWKNYNHSKYKGLCHYRRYFDINFEVSDIETLIKGHDLIAVKSSKMLSRRERAWNLMYMTSQEDYYIFADTFLTLYPEYEKEFMTYFYNSRESFPFQMFIASKEIYNDYCNFVFRVLFQVEEKLLAHGYSRQKRTIGYIGEWMLGLYIYCKKIKVKKIDIVQSETNNKNSFMSKAKHTLLSSIHSILDIINRSPKKIAIPSHVKAGLQNDGIKMTFLK